MELPKNLVGNLYSDRRAVVHTEVNSVIKTDHGKFLLVIKRTENLVVCCSINSDRVRFKPEVSQPKILQSENTFLKHDSFVDCAQLFSIDLNDFLENLDKGVFEPVGLLNECSMASVLRVGQTCVVLKKFEQDYFK